MFDTDVAPNAAFHLEAGDYTCDIDITNPLLDSWSDSITLNYRWEVCNAESGWENWIIKSTNADSTSITQYIYSVNRQYFRFEKGHSDGCEHS